MVRTWLRSSWFSPPPDQLSPRRRSQASALYHRSLGQLVERSCRCERRTRGLRGCGLALALYGLVTYRGRHFRRPCTRFLDAAPRVVGIGFPLCLHSLMVALRCLGAFLVAPVLLLALLAALAFGPFDLFLYHLRQGFGVAYLWVQGAAVVSVVVAFRSVLGYTHVCSSHGAPVNHLTRWSPFPIGPSFPASSRRASLKADDRFIRLVIMPSRSRRTRRASLGLASRERPHVPGGGARSAARAAASAGDSACGAVSMRHRAASWSRAVVRTSASRAALGGKDDRGICLTRVGPGGGASLGVKVHNERRVPGELGDNGQVAAPGTFSPRRLSARRWLWSACRHGDVLTYVVQPSISRTGVSFGRPSAVPGGDPGGQRRASLKYTRGAKDGTFVETFPGEPSSNSQAAFPGSAPGHIEAEK